MRVVPVLALAFASLAGARAVRAVAIEHEAETADAAPYAPSPRTAALVTLGYRELAADLLFVRLVGYYGSEHNTAQGIAALAEAMRALDPQFRRIYEVGAIAMQSARTGVDNAIH